MFRRILQISSFFVVFFLVFALPISVLAQEGAPAGTSGSSGSAMAPAPVFESAPMMPQQPMSQPFNNDNQSGSFNSGPTCNVNGVEIPGSCGDRQQMFGPNNMGPGPREGQMMGPPGGGDNGAGMGPSDEQRQKMDEKRQEMEKQQRQRGLQQMQRGVKSMAKPLATITARIAKLESQGIAVPAELKDNIAKAKSAVEAVLVAKDPEEVQDQMDILQEVGPNMGDTMRQLEMLARLPQMLKQADKEIARLDKAYVSSAAKSQRAKIDVSSVLEKWKTAIGELKTTLADVKQSGVGEGEDPMQVIGEEIFGRMEETWRFQQTIDMILNAKRNLKQVATAIKRYDRTIVSLKKKGTDNTEAESLLSEMKTKYDEVNKLVSSNGAVDPDEVESVLGDIQEYMDMQSQIEELLNLNGPSLFEKGMQGPASANERMPQLNMPQFNKMMMETKNLDSVIAQNWAKEEAKMLTELQMEKSY